MKTMYYVDVFNKNDDIEFTMLKTSNLEEAQMLAHKYNRANDGVESYADIIEIDEEETKMKKYELKDYKKFCEEALVSPPFEEFDNGTSDEEDWFDTHKIKIVAGEHEIELPYDADVVNEIEYALREMHEAIEGDGVTTTGNTFGSQYRPAEFKDVVRFYIMDRYGMWGGHNWFKYAHQAVDELSDMSKILEEYEDACNREKDIEFKCNWNNFKVETIRNATRDGIKKIILDLVGSDIEISYDPSTDKSFIIDYTFKESGDFIDWCWGEVNEDEQRVLLESYKETIFE